MIKSVEVVPGCIACKTCEGICPQVFKVEGTSHVIGYDFERYRQAVLRAERMCPVNVIKVERDDNDAVADVFSQAVLAKRIDLTSDVLELRFFVKGFSALPGQYVSLRLRDDVGEFIRSYSLVDFSQSHFTLCVKILADGRGGRVLSHLSAGDAVSVSPAVGHFTLRDTPAPKVFVATSTGIAPMMAMLSATPPETSKVVIFGVRLQEDWFYLDKLRAYPNTRVITTLSSPSPSWTGERGRVIAHLDAIARDAEVYICGNPAMVDSVREALAERGHSPALVFSEEFVDQSRSALASLPCVSRWRSFFLEGEVPGVRFVQYALFVASAAVPLLWYFTDLDWTLWDWSWYSVTLLMIIRPLADLFPGVLFFRAILPLRQGLGIFSSAVVATNAGFAYIPNASDFFSVYFSASHWSIANRGLFSHGAELVGLVLLLTSNELSRKLLGPWWKRIQRFSYVYFFFAGIYLMHLGKDAALPSMLLVGGLWLAAHIRRRLST